MITLRLGTSFEPIWFMPRRPTVLQCEFPYHVTGRCINREWFRLPMNDVWQIMQEELFFIAHAFEVQIHSFVLMNNHFHLLISTPRANLSLAMQRLMKASSFRLTRAGNRINQTYSGRYWRCTINKYHYFLHAYKYVYLNPVETGIVSCAEEYPFSTLNGLLGSKTILIPVIEDTLLFNDVEDTLAWVNERPTKKNWEAVSTALKKNKFQLSKHRNSNGPHLLETTKL